MNAIVQSSDIGLVYSSLNELYMSLTDLVGSRSIILIDGRVIAAYSHGKIVLPKSNMLDETRRSRGHLSYSIKGELFGQDYGQQLPYHLIFCSHVLLYHGSFQMKFAFNGGAEEFQLPDQKI
jgi:hypothetical protein